MASTWSGWAPLQIRLSIPRVTAESGEGSILLRQGSGFRARWRFVLQILFLVLAQNALLARRYARKQAT